MKNFILGVAQLPFAGRSHCLGKTSRGTEFDKGTGFLLHARHICFGKGKAGDGEILVKNGASFAGIENYTHIIRDGLQHFLQGRVGLHLPQTFQKTQTCHKRLLYCFFEKTIRKDLIVGAYSTFASS